MLMLPVGITSAGIETVPVQENGIEDAVMEEPYLFPKITPEVFFSGGFRFLRASGSERVLEYEYLRDTFTASGGARIFSFPSRLHLDLSIKNSRDYFGNLDYAFKDLILVRVLSRSIYHNLDAVPLLDLDPESPFFTTVMRDTERRHGTKSRLSDFFVRFKAPDFPLHLYVGADIRSKKGNRQLRFLGGSGYYNAMAKNSVSRDIDWETKSITVGTNSHLGPLEVDLSHGEKRFSASGGRTLIDTYTEAGFAPLPPVRPGGVYAHNAIPELKGASNSLKIHTSYAGGLVVSTTFSNMRRENTDSRAKAEYFIGAGEVTWIPVPEIAVFVKYRRKEAEFDNPSHIALTDLSGGQKLLYPVKPSISSDSDIVTGSVRYRAAPYLTFRAEYSYEHIRRDQEAAWHIPETTGRNTLSLSADARIAKKVTIKTRYTHKEISNPAYNSEPDRADEGRLSVTWTPVQRITAMASYGIAKQKRGDLVFVDAFDKLIPGPDRREVFQNRFMGSVTVLVLNDLSLTGTYAQMRNKTEVDIVYQESRPPFTNQVDPLLPYHDTMQHYSLNLGYQPNTQVTLATGIGHTESRGRFSPAGKDLLDPVPVAGFSDIKIRETLFSASGEYRFRNGFGLELSFRRAVFNDVLDNPHDDVEDGRAHAVLIRLSKRW